MPPAVAPRGAGADSWEYSLRKYLLLLATLVATVTYAAGFNPPGGVWQWQDPAPGPAAGRLAGDPIIRDTSYGRYLVFYYSNATAFASSLVVIVLILLLAVLHDRGNPSPAPLRTLRVVMVLDLLSLIAAYAAGTCRDALTSVYSAALVAAVAVYLAVHVATASPPAEEERDKPIRKVLMLLATFAVSVTYLAGLSPPGGFWDHAEGSHVPGDAVLKGGSHDTRLKVFFLCNNTAFVASLLIIVLLLDKKLRQTDRGPSWELYGFIVVALVGLVGAYSAGSCRQIDTTIYVNALVGAVLACILLQVILVRYFKGAMSWFWAKLRSASVLRWLPRIRPPRTRNVDGRDEEHQTQALEKARSVVQLLATLAATITYQAGLNPPGGLWQGDGDGYKAGDPILLTTNPRRYRAFFYCNSVAFVASLVAMILVQESVLLRHHALEAAMILDLFGLIGAYAAGSCRDVSTSIYTMALAGAVLVYVVIHIVFITLDHKDANGRGSETEADKRMEKRRKRLLLFAILAATMTYQAGLTPPSGFLLQDDRSGRHHAGDPVLLYNYPRRYRAFFYCNSASFMLSIALIILLVNPNIYRPAIRSNALSVCTAAGMCSLMGAYAAGSTQHLMTSIYIFALVAVVMCCVAFLVWSSRADQQAHRSDDGADADVEGNDGQVDPTGADVEEKEWRAKRKYLMVLGILVASVTYQAGLAPPGGVWQGGGGGGVAGDPVMHDNRRPRYLAFFYSNSTSFVASVVVIVLLLPEKLHDSRWWLGVMNTTIVLDLLGLLLAYAAGSSRAWKTSVIVSALVVAVLAYFAIHVALSFFSRRGRSPVAAANAPGANDAENGGRQAQIAVT
ncbi:hypothetical protein ACP70R_018204 [Stipagrostis hirtigluma subsp. patula]